MNLIKVNTVPNIFNRMDNLIDGLFNNYSDSLNKWAPNYDITGDNDRYIIEMEVPGIKKSDIVIETQDRIIKISTKKSVEQNNYSSISSREFEKEFDLPDDAIDKNTSASLKNGILEIQIPRKAEVKTKAKKIAIWDFFSPFERFGYGERFS